MSTPQTTAYRVSFVEWTSWEASVDASSEAEAVEKAEQLWDDQDLDALKIRDNGTEEWEVQS